MAGRQPPASRDGSNARSIEKRARGRSRPCSLRRGRRRAAAGRPPTGTTGTLRKPAWRRRETRRGSDRPSPVSRLRASYRIRRDRWCRYRADTRRSFPCRRTRCGRCPETSQGRPRPPRRPWCEPRLTGPIGGHGPQFAGADERDLRPVRRPARALRVARQVRVTAVPSAFTATTDEPDWYAIRVPSGDQVGWPNAMETRLLRLFVPARAPSARMT